MAEIPLVQECREARAEVARCTEAVALQQKLRLALTSLEILRRQDPDPLPDPLPGAELVETPGTTLMSHIGIVQQTLQLVNTTADRYQLASQTLHDLKHKQGHALDAPEFAELVQTIRTHTERAGELAKALAPATERLQLLTPFSTQLDNAIEAVDTLLTDPDNVVLKAMSDAHYGSLIGLQQSLNLQLGLPAPSDLTGPSHTKQVLARCHGALEAVRTEAKNAHKAIESERQAIQRFFEDTLG